MFDTLATDEMIAATVAALAKNGMEGIVVADSATALAKIQELIPSGVSVMNGSSVTLEQIGFIDYLKSGAHPWQNLHAAILAENDAAKRSHLRKQASLSDYYLGSVHGLAMTGEMVIGSNTGSQLPHIVFTSTNLIFVVGAQKIVPTLADARKRLEEYCLPLEDKRLRGLYGVGTRISKEVIFHAENPKSGRQVRVIIVKEKLGF